MNLLINKKIHWINKSKCVHTA